MLSETHQFTLVERILVNKAIRTIFVLALKVLKTGKPKEDLATAHSVFVLRKQAQDSG